MRMNSNKTRTKKERRRKHFEDRRRWRWWWGRKKKNAHEQQNQIIRKQQAITTKPKYTHLLHSISLFSFNFNRTGIFEWPTTTTSKKKREKKITYTTHNNTRKLGWPRKVCVRVWHKPNEGRKKSENKIEKRERKMMILLCEKSDNKL